MNTANVMNQLSSEQNEYQGYLDRGKEAMTNYDIEKGTHDALDQGYKAAKNLGKQLAEQAVGEKIMGGLEQGAIATIPLYRGVKVGQAMYKARQARLDYENVTGKKFNLKEAQANRAARAKTQADPSTQAKTETNEAGEADDSDLQNRLDALRRDTSGEEGGGRWDNPTFDESFPAPGARPPATSDLGQAADDVGSRADAIMARGRATRAAAREAGARYPTRVPPEAPTTTEGAAGAPGELRPTFDPREAFQGDTGMQEGTLGRTPLGHTEVYNPRTAPYDPAAERDARFSAREGGYDEVRGQGTIKSKFESEPFEDEFPAQPRAAQAPIEATQQMEAPISQAPTDAAQSFQERSAQQLSRVGAESEQESQMQGARAGQQSAEYRQELQQRQETMEGEGYKPAPRGGEGEGEGEGGAEDAPPVAPEAAEGGGMAAAEEAEAGALAGAEAAESAIPGIGELLMGATALGGAIYAAISGEHEKKPPPLPPPPPMPDMPHMANIAFASAPVIDSSSYHAL